MRISYYETTYIHKYIRKLVKERNRLTHTDRKQTGQRHTERARKREREGDRDRARKSKEGREGQGICLCVSART